MRRTLLIAATLLALAGCEQKPEAGQAGAATAAPAAGAPAATSPTNDPACAGKPDCGLLPPNVVIAVAHEHRRDWVYTAKPGIDRKQVIFEYTEGTPDTVFQSVEQSMKAAGFGDAIKDAGKGEIVSASFRKEGYGKVSIWVNPDAGAKPRNPNAKGVLGFDYPAPAGSTPIAAGN
jgi:hypothetical protein